MAKHPTFPTFYEDLKTISISFLKTQNYLVGESFKGGTITWSRYGRETGTISIKVNTQSETPYLELDYKYNQTPINYRVQLVSIPSNLGNGVIWFFICPHTGKRCRILYSGDSYFLHRTAFLGCMYEKQTYSKKTRQINIETDAYFKTNQLSEQLYKKHFKKLYAGKPTKKYLLLTKLIQKNKTIIYQQMERFDKWCEGKEVYSIQEV